MKKILSIFLLAAVVFFSRPVYSQDRAYNYLMGLAKTQMQEGRYERALHYFTLAQLADPEAEEAMFYVNLMKRLIDGRVVSEEDIQTLKHDYSGLEKSLDHLSKEVANLKEKSKLIGQGVNVPDAADQYAQAGEQTKQKIGQAKEDAYKLQGKIWSSEVESQMMREDVEELKNSFDDLDKQADRLLKWAGGSVAEAQADYSSREYKVARTLTEFEKIRGRRKFANEGGAIYQVDVASKPEATDDVLEVSGGQEYVRELEPVADSYAAESEAVEEAVSGKYSYIPEAGAIEQAEPVVAGVLGRPNVTIVKGIRKSDSRSSDQPQMPPLKKQPAFEPVPKQLPRVQLPVSQLAEDAQRQKLVVKQEKTISLEQQDMAKFPLFVEITSADVLKVVSKVITRFLVTMPEVIGVERLDTSSIKIFAKDFGSSYVHVWDQTGRWTFEIKAVPPGTRDRPKKSWEKNKGLRFTYNSDYNNAYSGRNLDSLRKDSLRFDQRLSVKGPIPYGDFSGKLSWTAVNQQQDITGYSVGLTKGRFMDFRDFAAEGFDISRPFSDLTFSGMKLRGFYFESPAFDKRVKYSYISGREQDSFFGSLSPGVTDKKKSFIRGHRFGFLPTEANNIYFNYVEGWGHDRSSYLKDKVFSAQYIRGGTDVTFDSEVAYDQDRVASKFYSGYKLGDSKLRLAYRNIDAQFVSITGRPSGRGEIGGKVGWAWQPESVLSWSSNLDIYRDRYLYNTDDPNELNYKADSTFNYSFDDMTSLTASLYYANTAGTSFPYRSLNGTTTYTKRLEPAILNGRGVDTHMGYAYQRSINPLTPDANYRTDGGFGGVRIQITPDLGCYVNYQHTWVDELDSGIKVQTKVWETGLDLYQQWNRQLSSNLRAYYRDESGGNSLHSFISNEDSLSLGATINYKPGKDVSFYVNGRSRVVWPADNQGKGVDASFRAGARIGWDSVFSFGAATRVEGYVFKDANGNGAKDDDEEGVAGVKVTVGPKETTTDYRGKYRASIRAKNCIVGVDVNDFPRGYISTTPVSLKVETDGGVKEVSFGVSSQSGIHGVVFFDADGDGKLSREDAPLARVKITLDKARTTVTNSEGVYYFGELKEGKHEMVLDVNSLPREYLPKVSAKKEMAIIEGLTYNYNIPLSKIVAK